MSVIKITTPAGACSVEWGQLSMLSCATQAPTLEARSWELGTRQHEMARRCNKDASGKRASVSLGINVGRLHPSHGSGRISWWNSSGPPEKNCTTRNAGKVPASKRVAYHNGTYSKYFVLLPLGHLFRMGLL